MPEASWNNTYCGNLESNADIFLSLLCLLNSQLVCYWSHDWQNFLPLLNCSPVVIYRVRQELWITLFLYHFSKLGCILGRNWDKNLKIFASCCSQSPLPADFTLPYCPFLNFRFLQQQLKVGGGLALVTIYSIFLFTFESSIALCRITLFYM